MTKSKQQAGFGMILIAALAGCGSGGEEDAATRAARAGFRGPPRATDLLRATADFGPALVQEGEYTYTASFEPWSGWWYPATSTFLFDKSDLGSAPLEKYDAYVMKMRSGNGQAAGFERDRLYNRDESSWAGLCNAWAMAAIMVPEPKVNGVRMIEGIPFTTADLKALVTKTFESFDKSEQKKIRVYGQRFEGKRGANDLDDIYPDQFHRILQSQLAERRFPFIMDDDPSEQVWNKPVFRADLKIAREPGDASLMHVEAWVFEADPHVDATAQGLNFTGTLPVIKHYTYDLRGNPQGDGRIQVTYGAWTGRSVDDHPDFATVVLEKLSGKSFNRELDRSKVEEIVRRATQ